MASFQRYTLRTPGITLTQAASLFSTSARATRCASSAEAQVLSTTILSVIIAKFFSLFLWIFWQKRIINKCKDSYRIV